MWRDAACMAWSQQGGHSFWGHNLTFKLPCSQCLSGDDAKPLEYLSKCLLWWCISPSNYHRGISGKLWTLFQAQSPKLKALLAGEAGKCRVLTMGRVVEGIPQGPSTASANKSCCLFMGPKCLRRAEKCQDVAECWRMVSHHWLSSKTWLSGVKDTICR